MISVLGTTKVTRILWDQHSRAKTSTERHAQDNQFLLEPFIELLCYAGQDVKSQDERI